MYLPTCPLERLYALLFPQRALYEFETVAQVRLQSSPAPSAVMWLDLSTCGLKCLEKCLRTVLCYEKKKKELDPCLLMPGFYES